MIKQSRLAPMFVAVLVWAAFGLHADAAASNDAPTLDELLEIPSLPTTSIDGGTTARDGDQVPDDLLKARSLIDPLIERKLSDAGPTDLFKEAVAMMDVASQRLTVDKDPGLGTQRIQQSTLAKLDQLIAEVRKRQCEACKSGSSKPQDNDSQSSENNAKARAAASPNGQSENRGAPSPGRVTGVDPTKTPIEQLRREWGHLPARLRAELMQGLDERFSPIYKRLTEAYYRRLAEEGK